MKTSFDSSLCCGCEACVQACPVQCISVQLDEEGFIYPVIDSERCINCNKCESVCPILHKGDARRPIKCYAAQHKDDTIRRLSSSGGVFSALAEYILKHDGVVFGASYDADWNVVHTYIESVDQLPLLRGSKYIQSDINNTYVKVKEFLNTNRLVLFTGTSCQILGLHNFLRKNYDNLITVDIICHGVPSPLVWQNYLSATHQQLGRRYLIENVSFRDKRVGWKQFGTAISVSRKGKRKEYFNVFNADAFMKCFLRNYTLRPSCYNCPAKNGTSKSDLTIGDFWGIDSKHPEIDDDMGCSAVLAYTSAGVDLINKAQIVKHEVPYASIVEGNPVVEKPVTKPKQREEFWDEFTKAETITKKQMVIDKYAEVHRQTKLQEKLEKIHYLLLGINSKVKHCLSRK